MVFPTKLCIFVVNLSLSIPDYNTLQTKLEQSLDQYMQFELPCIFLSSGTINNNSESPPEREGDFANVA